MIFLAGRSRPKMSNGLSWPSAARKGPTLPTLDLSPSELRRESSGFVLSRVLYRRL